MASYIIEGGYSLQGSIRPQGAKNEALQIISAVLLTPEVVTIHNIPNILDVNNLIDLLRHIGVKVTRLNDEGSYTFQADEVNIEYLHSEEFLSRSRALRGSILMAGALLGRFGYAISPSLGAIRSAVAVWTHTSSASRSSVQAASTTPTRRATSSS